MTFAGQFDAGVRVLNELSDFCFEKRNTFDETSSRNTDVNQGRREVILHIRRILEKNIKDEITFKENIV